MKPRIEQALAGVLAEVATLPKRKARIETLREIANAVNAERDRLSSEAAADEALEREALLDPLVIAAVEAAKARLIAERSNVTVP